jgi:hypothetical protein
MSRTYHNGDRRIRVRGIKRKTPDLRRLGRALIEFAQQQAEIEAETEHGREGQETSSPPRPASGKAEVKRRSSRA